MKERPILFSAPMVRAILDGRKTQTRRVVKPQPPHWDWTRVPEYAKCRGLTQRVGNLNYWIKPCPYGRPGDRLWVKETWAPAGDWHQFTKPTDIPQGTPLTYAADLLPAQRESVKPLRPSLFMRRWMSRITLEITGVRVEQLNDISEEDARAEGVTLIGGQGYDGWAKQEYIALWGSINGPGSWAANPWVWVVSFRRVKP